MENKTLLTARWRVLFSLLVLFFISSACTKKTTPAPQTQFAQDSASHAEPLVFPFNRDEIVRWRIAKDDYLKNDSLSPLPAFDKERFKGLRYYEPSEKHCVTARFAPINDGKTVIVETTQSYDYRKMQRVGTLTFTIGADTCVLVGYVDTEAAKTAPPVLAVYFKDLTNAASGAESNDGTYEAGRYLELPYKENATEYTLDFNRAFSPYCSYNSLYACPLVPRENWLRVSIEAGEKKYLKP